MAHLWISVNKARNFQENVPAQIYNVSGLRSRIKEFADSNAGCFTLSSCVSIETSSLDEDHLSETARILHEKMDQFDRENTMALLHQYYHTESRRISPYFGSKSSSISTSWLYTDSWNVHFGGKKPRMVVPRIPPMDGLMIYLEGGELEKGGPWHEKGAIVYINLQKKDMEKLLHDSTLRKYTK